MEVRVRPMVKVKMGEDEGEGGVGVKVGVKEKGRGWGNRPAHHRSRGQVCLDLLGPVEGKHRPIECQPSKPQPAETGLPQASWQGAARGGKERQGAARGGKGRQGAALPRRRLWACCPAATRAPRTLLGSPRGWYRRRLVRG